MNIQKQMMEAAAPLVESDPTLQHLHTQITVWEMELTGYTRGMDARIGMLQRALLGHKDYSIPLAPETAQTAIQIDTHSRLLFEYYGLLAIQLRKHNLNFDY